MEADANPGYPDPHYNQCGSTSLITNVNTVKQELCVSYLWRTFASRSETLFHFPTCNHTHLVYNIILDNSDQLGTGTVRVATNA